MARGGRQRSGSPPTSAIPALAADASEGSLAFVFVCQCAALTDRDVLESIAKGACTVAAVCRDIGAGRGCGGCVPTVRELVCEHCPLSEQNRLEVAGAAR